MATGFQNWSQTAGSNNTASSNINWSEGQAASTVNNSARGMMSELSQFRDDLTGVTTSNGVQTVTGTNDLTLTTNGSSDSLINGWTLTFVAAATNTGAMTFAPDGLAAKAIVPVHGTALIGGEIVLGKLYTITYHKTNDEWLLWSNGPGEFASGTDMLFVQATAPSGWSKQVVDNDFALRLVTGATGGSTGGSTAFTTVFASRTIAQANLPNVSFTISASVGTSITNGTSVIRGASEGAGSGAGSDGYVRAAIAGSTLSLASGTVTGTAASGGSGTALDFAVKYVDVIWCAKN